MLDLEDIPGITEINGRPALTITSEQTAKIIADFFNNRIEGLNLTKDDIICSKARILCPTSPKPDTDI